MANCIWPWRYQFAGKFETSILQANYIYLNHTEIEHGVVGLKSRNGAFDKDMTLIKNPANCCYSLVSGVTIFFKLN